MKQPQTESASANLRMISCCKYWLPQSKAGRLHSNVLALSIFVFLGCRLVQEVETARVEAVDNAKYLAPLRKPLQRFTESDDFSALPDKFKVLFTES